MSFFNKTKNFLYAYATLTGTIIGVGIFSLPYVTAQSGWWLMGVYALFLGLISIYVHIFWARVVAKTRGNHRLPGVARIYLGKFWGRVVAVTAIGSLMGSILAYVIVGARFSHGLWNGFLPVGEWAHVVIYCLLGAILVALGDKVIAKLEVWGIAALVLILGVLAWRSSGNFTFDNLWAVKGEIKNFFLPYGIILFSFWGASAIPEIRDILGRNKKLINSVIIFSSLTVFLVYAFFALVVLGLGGSAIGPSALESLSAILGAKVERILLAMGIVTTFTSYITLILALSRLLTNDLGVKPKLALAIVTIVPAGLYFGGVNNFIATISFVGSVMLAIDGMAIAAIYRKAFGESAGQRWLISLIVFCFLAGIIYEIYRFI